MEEADRSATKEEHNQLRLNDLKVDQSGHSQLAA